MIWCSCNNCKCWNELHHLPVVGPGTNSRTFNRLCLLHVKAARQCGLPSLASLCTYVSNRFYLNWLKIKSGTWYSHSCILLSKGLTASLWLVVSRCFCTWFCCFSVAGSIGFAISRCLVVYQMLLYGISTSYKNISII